MLDLTCTNPEKFPPRVHWAERYRFDAPYVEGDAPNRESHFLLVLEGEVEARVNGRTLRAQAGTLMVSPRHARLCQRFAAGTTCVRLLFASGSLAFDDAPRVLDLGDEAMARRWIEDVCALHEENTMRRDVTGPLLEAILARLTLIEQRELAHQTRHPSVVQTMKFIEANLRASLSLELLARRVNLSASHLRALFRQQVGSGPLRYQLDLRMQKALQLVEGRDLNIAEIARECGYNDPEYFSRRFRAYHHLPPSELRRKRRAEDA